MPLKRAQRIPRKYNRPVSAKTRALAERRRGQRKKWKKEKIRRGYRRVQRAYKEWQQFVVRWFLVGLIITLIVALILLLFSPMVRVREMRISRTDSRLDIEQVQHSLAPLFGRHTMFLPEFEIIALLEETIPDLGNVEINKIYPAELDIRITLDPLVAQLDIVALGEEPATSTGGVLDYLTDEGVYIATDVPQDLEGLPRIRVTDWGARPQSGMKIVPSAFLERMGQAEDELLNQFGQKTLIRAIYMRAQEFHLLVEAPTSGEGGAYSMWFDVQSSLEKQLVRYRTFLHSVGPDAITEYIDLRIHDRVIYK